MHKDFVHYAYLIIAEVLYKLQIVAFLKIVINSA